MKHARITTVVLGLLLASACTAKEAPSVPTGDTTPTSPADAATADAGPETAAPEPKKDAAPPAPPAGECSSSADQTACVECCSSKHEDGSAVYFVALIDCMCLEANCARDCATTLCDTENPKNANASCQACVQGKNSACAPTIKATCTAEPDCVAFDKCIGQSDCAGK